MSDDWELRKLPTFEEDQWVEVKHPLTPDQAAGPRSEWPWVPGYVAQHCGGDEWEVVVQDPAVARIEGGEAFFPAVFRDHGEIREVAPERGRQIEREYAAWQASLREAEAGQ